MLKKLLSAALLATAIGGAASTASAEGEQFQGFYTVAEIGYENGAAGFDQFNFGGAIGGNLKLGQHIFIGAEGEFLGSSSSFVDFTYGGHGQLGVVFNNRHAAFLRGGYREFEFDLGEFGSISAGGYSLGFGGQAEISDNVSIRTIVDTVEFDTIGVRTGLVFHF
ncbi:MAG: hypothetical protein AAGK23_11110 [Pseudomonadota bacterium]